jgi:glycosyltransferase involved in cell wall biosynthesis
MSVPMRITVVTPSYNMGKYLEDAILSIVSQAGVDLEFFVFDGGSRDNSRAIIKKYKDKISYWISQPDGGQAAVVKRGLEMASGDIFAWANADDKYLPGTVQFVSDVFSTHPEVDILFGGWNFTGSDGAAIDTRWLKGFTLRKFHKGSLVPPQPAVFLRTEAVRKAGGISAEMRHAMDYDLYVRIAREGNVFVTERVLGDFRLHRNSKTQSEKGDQFRELREARAKYFGDQATLLEKVNWKLFDVSVYLKDFLHRHTGMFSLRRGIKNP